MTQLYSTVANLTPGEYVRIHTVDHTVDVWVEEIHHHEYRAETAIDVVLQNDDQETMGLYLMARSIPSRPVLHRVPQVHHIDNVDSDTGGVVGETTHIVHAVDRLDATTSLAQKQREGSSDAGAPT